ncbi:RrF2 family transcriptional regulator [Tropicimonas sp. S265A]|uniref:RrF2 family transcriptional regulator n=1 Tax=Tropicimonas sp. S265A TaxID=3415134 RepID=UPI003C7BDA57
MRLTTRTNLAMRTLMYCAVNTGRNIRTSEVAKATNASENHLGQVINMLGQKGFIETVRGRGGGIRLARDPEDITVGGVFRVFEAGVPFAECFADDCTCPLVSVCRLKGALGEALTAFYRSLDKITLSSLVKDNSGLKTLFSDDHAIA